MNTNRILRHVFISLLGLMAVVFAGVTPRAQAAAIHRCLDSDGGKVFSDTACGAQGLTARVPEPRQRPGAATRPAAADQRLAAGSAQGIGCVARSPNGMRAAVGDAIAAGNVNALSGLYDWRGSNRASAMATMRVLRDLTHKPVLAIELDRLYPGGPVGDTFAFREVPDRQALPLLRVDQHAYADGGPVTSTHLRMKDGAGCLWLAL